MMWFQPASYRASLLARGKSMDYIERVMVPSNMETVSWFFTDPSSWSSTRLSSGTIGLSKAR